MARNEQPHEDQFEYEELDESRASEDTPFGPTPLAGSGAFTSTTLLVTGFLFVAFGVALQAADRIDPRLAEIQRTLEANGAAPFVVTLTGFVAFGFGLVHRAARRPQPTPAVETSTEDVERQERHQMELVGELHTLRESVNSVVGQLASLAARQQELQTQLLSATPEQSDVSPSNEAMFSLAAGVDKLHAMLDKQVGALAKRNEADIAKLGGTLALLREELQTGEAAAVRHAPARPEASAPSQHSTVAQQSTVAPDAGGAGAFQESLQSKPDVRAAASEPRDIYAEAASLGGAPERSDEPEEEPIDSERMVIEGLGALEQLEDGRSTEEAREPEDSSVATQAPSAPVASDAPSAPVATQAPEPPEPTVSDPQPALPEPQDRAEALESLLPEDALRDALDGRV